MKANEQVQNELTSLIYSWLFGMTRDEMLVECKKHKRVNWQPIQADEDENMRDHLSIAALYCLSGAEEAVAGYINKYGWGWSESCIAEYHMLILPYIVEGLVIWEDEV